MKISQLRNSYNWSDEQAELNTKRFDGIREGKSGVML
jgi:hypothetical protein